METIIAITNLLLLGLAIVTPIILLYVFKRLKYKRIWIIYFLISLLLTGGFLLVFSWWADKSNMILLDYYGYNSDAWTDLERYQNVTQENIEEVKKIKISMMGIGWPVKAIFGLIMLIPYLGIVYLGNMVFDKVKKRRLIERLFGNLKYINNQ